MQWQENSIILSTRLFSENFRRVTVFNSSHGKVSGLLRGLKVPVNRGDISSVTWKGKNADQLGTLIIENIFSPFVHAFNSPPEIMAIDTACTLCYLGIPEKAPHQKLYEAFKNFLFSVSRENKYEWLKDYAFFELIFLSEVGMGLDLTKCAVTKSSENLFYVSPRTGRAVSREAGEKYHDKLFLLPEFFYHPEAEASIFDIYCALEITKHFLSIYFYGINNRELPLSRVQLVQWLQDLVEEQGKTYENQCNS